MNHDFRPLKTYLSGKNDRNALLTKDTKIPTDSDFKKLTPNSKTGKLEQLKCLKFALSSYIVKEQ